MAEPIRLQKYLSDCGILSRRAAESAIVAGLVLVNGMTAELGQKVTPKIDSVVYRGKPVFPREDKPYRYILLNKPRGIVSTARDEKGRPTVTELVRIPGVRLYPVGRLDMDSDGLLLLTDDGSFANLLTHPRHEIPKLYRVSVSPAPSREQLHVLSTPMELDGYQLLPVNVHQISDSELEMQLFEGRNRQIRRMCEAVGLKITRLRRIAIGKLTLGELPPGAWRELTAAEVAYLTTHESQNQSKGSVQHAGGITDSK